MTTKGTIQLKNGVYEGQYVLSQSNSSTAIRQGNGVMNYANGNKYTGEWKGDSFDGNGEYVWADGRIFKGRYKEGKMHGQGEMLWPDGRTYLQDARS